MPAIYDIRQLPDGPRERFIGSRGNYYELSPTETIDLNSVPAWCPRCVAFKHGETLSTVEAIDAEIRDLRDPTSERYRDFKQIWSVGRPGFSDRFPESLREWLDRLTLRRAWRAARRSPPRCIHCGCDEITILPIDEPTPDPRAPGRMMRIDHVLGHASTSFNEWFFTPEGVRITRDTRPTHWHHPILDR